MTDLLPRLLPTLRRLLPPGSRVVACVSGGPDSQVLLDCLARARVHLDLGALWAVGVDHGLRPAAPAELALAATLAAAHGVPWAVVRAAVSRRGNLLAAARRGRYAALAAWAADQGGALLALGHTADDQAETVLQRLIRGSALAGAGAMRPRRGLRVRPLLGTDRAAIEAHLTARGIACARDPSNLDPARARARLRTQVLPGLVALNPRACAHLAAFAGTAREDEAALAALAGRALARAQGAHGELALAVLGRQPAAIGRRALRAWLGQHGLAADRAALVALWTAVRAGPAAPPWARCVAGTVLRREHGALWPPPPPAAAAAVLAPGGTYPLQWAGARLRVRLRAAAAATVPRGRQEVAFDADRLHFALTMRPWQKGDRLRPFAGRGSVTVGDLFTDAKCPRALRPSWPVVVHGDEVAWVVGIRRGDQAPLGPRSRRAIWLKVEGPLPRGAC